MQRRSFIKNKAFCAVAVSTSGFIRFDGTRYTGDCETTTDILGPFYRPNSPVRNNLVRTGDPGTLVELSGIIKHKDCITPYKGAKIELWHCNAKGEYDNETKEYRYRGTTYCDDKGHYSFDTVLPVPYDAGGGLTRPAHFHLMITAAGYQPLITQLYFSGDANIAKDPWASSANAKRRILDVQDLNNGTKKVLYDVGMSDKMIAEPATIEKLTGAYVYEKDKTKKVVFFKRDNQLWQKNDLYGENLEYTGNNTFQYSLMPAGTSWTFQFEPLKDGSVKLTEVSVDEKGKKEISVATREK